MRNTFSRLRSFSRGSRGASALVGLAGCLLVPACATLGGGGKGATGTATGAQLTERNTALEKFAAEAMKACSDKGKAEDRGVFIVVAKPDGSLSLGPAQWLGSAEMKQCLETEIPKARLPAWTGPTVTWLWSLGSKENPAPGPVPAPQSYDEKQQEQVRRTQGAGNDTTTGPLSACAMRSLGPEAYAVVKLKLFIYPDGKVVGVTPIGNDAEGKDAAYMDCVVDLVKEWTFPPFQGPAFTTMDIQLRFGVPPEDRSGH